MKELPAPTLHLRVFACSHVLDGHRPVLLVSRDEGDWCFLCGGDDHEQSATDFIAVGLSHVLEGDSSLAEVMDLEPGWEAERQDLVSPWARSEYHPNKP